MLNVTRVDRIAPIPPIQIHRLTRIVLPRQHLYKHIQARHAAVNWPYLGPR